MFPVCIFLQVADAYWTLAADKTGSFPVVMVGGVLESNKSWDIGKEVINYIQKIYPGAQPIRPKVTTLRFDMKFI